MPFGAGPILEARRAGQKPVLPVLVSLIGRLPLIDGPVVVAEPGAAYDWRFLVGLETHIWVKDGIDARRTFIDIAAAGAWAPQVWDAYRKVGAFLQVDPSPEVGGRIEAALTSGSERRLRQAVEHQFDEPGVSVWLAPWGPIFNETYARGTAHLDEVLP